jgi:hypothetical protein
MKKTLLTLALVASTMAAFAQGRVTFINDTLHIFTITTDPNGRRPADVAGPVAGPLPSGVTLIAGLYAGTSSSSLALQSTKVLTAANFSEAGAMSGLAVNLAAGLPGNTTIFFQVAVWDNAFANPTLAFAGGSYQGLSAIFTATPSTSAITAPSILPGGTSASTWANGPVTISTPVPEPSTLALAGLGMASMLVLRRRK